MPKINFGVADAADIAAADGYPVYKGDLPPNGAYEGALRVVKVAKIGSGNEKGKSRLQLVVILDDPNYPEYDGCPMFGGLNLTDQGVPYVNQFLESLTDGSDKAKAAIKTAFWKTGPIVDNAKEHIVKIGRTNVNSPKGELRVIVGVKQRTWEGNTTLSINQYMIANGEGSPSKTEEAEIVEEDDDIAEVEVDDDTTVDDDEDPYAEDEDVED